MDRTRRRSVLIVEDELSWQENYEDIVSENYHYEIAPTKDAAVAYLREQVFDIAIIDMRLRANDKGNTEGLEVAQYIRDVDAPIELILSSGFPAETQAIRDQIEQLRFVAVIDKSADGLSALLRSALAQAGLRLDMMT